MTVDVLISGAGPAGTLLAYHLAPLQILRRRSYRESLKTSSL